MEEVLGKFVGVVLVAVLISVCGVVAFSYVGSIRLMFDATRQEIEEEQASPPEAEAPLDPETEVPVGGNVYSGEGLTVTPSTLDWGTIDPSANVTRSITVTNNWNGPATLTLNASDWNPPLAEDYLTLIWDYDGTPLEGKQSVNVDLSLIVSPDIKDVNSFFFNIRVTAVWG